VHHRYVICGDSMENSTIIISAHHQDVRHHPLDHHLIKFTCATWAKVEKNTIQVCTCTCMRVCFERKDMSTAVLHKGEVKYQFLQYNSLITITRYKCSPSIKMHDMENSLFIKDQNRVGTL
jgi:hypothetical protein